MVEANEMRNWSSCAVRCLLHYNVLAAAVATWTVFSFSMSTAPISPDWAPYSLLFPWSKSLIFMQSSDITSTHLHCTHFNPESGDSSLSQNVCVHRKDCAVSQYRRTDSKFPTVSLPVRFTAIDFVPVSGIKCEISESEFNIKY